MEALAFGGAFLVLTLLGVLAGAVTGLSPGLHVNNVAALLLASRASWALLVVALLPSAINVPGAVALLLACFLMATAVSHSVFDFVPSVFFGAPSEDTALSVLPGHRLLLQGRGAAAVALAARGALFGTLASVPMLLVLRILLAAPVGLYEHFRPWTAVFLVGLLAALLLSETPGRRDRVRRVARAVWVQVLSGVLGVAVLRGVSGLPSEEALFPLFAGLFGLPNLILAVRRRPAAVPMQRLEPLGPVRRAEAVHALRGTLAGASVSWLPGLSGGAAATLATLRVRGRPEAASFMVVLGAVSTSTAVLSVAMLYVIGRARSGAAVGVQELLGVVPPWSHLAGIPESLLLLVASAGISAAASAPVSAALARAFAFRWSAMDPRRIARLILGIVVALVVAITGPPGLAIVALGALVGIVPVVAGVRRVHLMASLLLPVLLGYVGL